MHLAFMYTSYALIARKIHGGYNCSHFYEDCLGKAVGTGLAICQVSSGQSCGEAMDPRRAELTLTRQLGFSTMLQLS